MTKKKKLSARTTNVNLGCGTQIVPSTKSEKWINIDNSIGAETPDFLQGDARQIPLESGTVDYLLCDNVLEHIAMSDVAVVLQEIRRVLKVGGRAIIIVPDFRNAVESWLKIDHDHGFNPFYYYYLSEVIYGNQLHEGEFHKTPMCPGFLSFALKVAGFWQAKIITHPQFGDAPAYPGCASAGKQLRQAEIVCDITKTS